MTLRELFTTSLYALILLGSGMLCLGEGTLFPAGLTSVIAILAWIFNERDPHWSVNRWATNGLGLLAAAAAVGEFLGNNIEARLLSGAHFLTYMTWIVLFQRKSRREYWWLGAFLLLQVAVGSVLTSSGLYGFLVLLFVMLMLWTMAVGNILFRAQDLKLLPGFLQPDSNVPLAVPGEIVDPSTDERARAATVRHGICQDSPGHWMVGGFVFSVASMAVLGVLFGFLVFLLVPRFWIGSGNPFLNATVGGSRTVTGYSRDIRLGHLGEILEDSTRVFQVRLFDRDSDTPLRPEELAAREGLDEPYFRGDVFDHYQSGRWRAVDRDEKSSIMPWWPKPAGLVRQEYILEEGVETAVVAMRPADLAYAMAPYQALEWGSVSHTLMARDFSRSLKEYSVWSRREPHADLPPIEDPASEAISPSVAERYRKYPANLTRVRDLADEVVGNLDQPNGSIEKQTTDRLVQFLRDSGQYSYSLRMRVEDPSLDPLEDFLFNTRQGHCEYFATALAILLRTQGIHSRLVTGYKGALEDRYSGYFEVQRRNSHAWVEAWFDGAWHTLDAVPYAADDETRQFVTNRGFWGNARNSLNSLWSNYFVSMSIDRQQSQLYGPLGRVWDSVKSGTQGLVDFFRDFGSTDPSGGRLSRGRGPWMWLGLLTGVSLLRWLLRAPSRSLSRSGSGTPSRWPGLLQKLLDRWWHGGKIRQESSRLYGEFLAAVARRGLIREQHQTQQEFALRVEQQFQGCLSAAGLCDFPRQITQMFYDTEFGGHSFNTELASRMQRQLSHFSKAISQASQARHSNTGKSLKDSATT
jgi:transglutaminase-like putative cysteine protease